jgi:hypothetical protein
MCIALAFLESHCTKFHSAGWKCWFLTSFYVESFIWPDVISRWIRQGNSIKFCAYLGNCETETLAMIIPALGKYSVSHTRKARTHRDRKKRQMKNKDKGMLIIFFDIKVIVHKEFVLASQTVNLAYCCDLLRWLCKYVPRIHLELWRQKNCLLHRQCTVHTSFFNREFFFLPKNDMTIVPYPPFSSLFSR